MTVRSARAPHEEPMERAGLFAGLPEGRITVTGGAGFVGSHLVERLLELGRHVHVVDDLSSGSLEHLAAVRGDARLSVTVGSVAEPAVAARAADAAAVFHLAGMVGVQRLAQKPLDVMRGNLRCTEVMLEAAKDNGVPILIASSSEVYGDSAPPFRETDAVQPGATGNLRGGYACAKAMGEWLARAHALQHGLRVVVARLFNIVGPRQSGAYGMVLPRFVAQAQQGRPITVYGDGAQTRCFAHVREVVDALVMLLASERAHGGTFNVGSDREVRVLELARLVKRATQSTSPIVLVPHERVFPEGFVDPQRRVPCLERLRSCIGFAPSQPIESIVDELCAVPASDALQRALAARAMA